MEHAVIHQDIGEADDGGCAPKSGIHASSIVGEGDGLATSGGQGGPGAKLRRVDGLAKDDLSNRPVSDGTEDKQMRD